LSEKWSVNFACDSDFHVNRRDLFTYRKSATWDKRLYFPCEGRHAVDFFARKIRRLRPSSNPRSWVPEASMLTTRTPKSLSIGLLTSLYMLCYGSVCVVQILMLCGHNCALFIPQIRRGGVHYKGQVRLVTTSHPFQTSWCRRKQFVLAQNGVQTAICLLTSMTIEADT
jgi:hypothetical protein